MITLIISLVVPLVVVGVLLYLLGVLVPTMDPRITKTIYALVGLVLFFYVLQLFGLWHGRGFPAFR